MLTVCKTEDKKEKKDKKKEKSEKKDKKKEKSPKKEKKKDKKEKKEKKKDDSSSAAPALPPVTPRLPVLRKSTILGVHAREILDSRGNPTIEVDVKVRERGLHFFFFFFFFFFFLFVSFKKKKKKKRLAMEFFVLLFRPVLRRAFTRLWSCATATRRDLAAKECSSENLFFVFS
jgi:hypothetical protein